MNVVDSSGWLEYFADGPNADDFTGPITDKANLIVPVITLYEVFKRSLQQRGEQAARVCVAAMQEGRVVDIDVNLALSAAKLSFDLKLPMADSLILATARLHGATLWTQDDDFASMPGVRYIPKPKG